MTDLNFQPVEEPTTDAAGFESDACRCPNPDDQYLLEIDASTMHLTHTACGKPVDYWADDAINLPPTSVTLKWTAITDNHAGEVSDAWGDLTINGLPEDVRETAEAMGRRFDEQARARHAEALTRLAAEHGIDMPGAS